MKSLALFVSVILSAILASAATHSVPEDGPDGLYIHHIDDDGNSTYQYWGEAPAPVFARSSEVPELETLKKRDGATCDSFQLDGNDADGATDGLAEWFGCGQQFKGKNGASYKWGSVVAYGCDYGNGQSYTSIQFLSDIAAVKAKCGSNAGYFAHSSWKSSYGLTQTSQGFC
ncbi:MAG: hypothetical protein M1813_007519 [Trichoglossum hirsutum]|jgi:hypothetical protein|nr:MAG: hypothetical protein M1813_007519 [Trichoglossum hirsutum]